MVRILRVRNMTKKIVRLSAYLGVLFSMGLSFAVQADNSVQAARAVMDDFMRTFNARNEAAWADTLLFPHIRVASGAVRVDASKAEFVANADLDEFARVNNWARSEWDSIELIQAGDEKVHFKVKFSRFNPQGERYVTFDSLYILQKVDGRWGIRARSSFAP